jgi:protein SCO1/2
MKAIALAALITVVMTLDVSGQHQHHAAPGAPPRSNSVYELSASLVDQDGARVGLDLFRGHPVLISMFYTTCPDACPLLIADLKRIERELPAARRAALRVVLVSLDPKRDTPGALRGLARAHGLDTSRWRLLCAPDDTVREIAAVLGIRYRQLPEGGFNHSSVITLLDPAGVVLARVEGLGQPTDALREALRARQ